jgi:3',5'-cyclic AMP phosphodiesterase CpdA
MAGDTGSSAGGFVIAQLSDIHCGSARFDEDLMKATIEDINDVDPDVVVVGGDLTAGGYKEEFEEAHAYLDGIDSAPIVPILGNHDCRNVGWVHFQGLFGETHHADTFEIGKGDDGVPNERIRVVATNSNRPDINEGEIGLRRYDWITEAFDGDYTFRVFVLHHHLVPIPGTGRERSVVLDGGDVLWMLGRSQVELILSGHKHVPWVWDVGSALIVTSGTASTWRTRGDTPPSYNVIQVEPDEITVTFKNLTGTVDVVQRFSRQVHRRRAGWNE